MKKKAYGFSFIELLTVVAVLAILAMIAVPLFKQYKERTQNAATQNMLQLLALAQVAYAVDHDGHFLIPLNPSDISAELTLLSMYGLRPDNNIAMAILPSPPLTTPSFRIFAINQEPGSHLYIYDHHMGAGAIQVKDKETVFPTKLSLYTIGFNSGKDDKIIITKGRDVSIDPVTLKALP